jgi:uncharacterized protein YjhX (UPF0386 family)
MRLTAAQQRLLLALAGGATLKVQRTMDGAKVYRLYPLDSPAAEEVQPAVVEPLQRQRLIESNMKFPAAVFLLTEQGAAAVAGLAEISTLPVGPRSYLDK